MITTLGIDVASKECWSRRNRPASMCLRSQMLNFFPRVGFDRHSLNAHPEVLFTSHRTSLVLVLFARNQQTSHNQHAIQVRLLQVVTRRLLLPTDCLAPVKQRIATLRKVIGVRRYPTNENYINVGLIPSFINTTTRRIKR